MRKALADTTIEPAFREHLFTAFGQTADHMINRPG
jgi:truncated hemoglobin YjbI